MGARASDVALRWYSNVAILATCVWLGSAGLITGLELGRFRFSAWATLFLGILLLFGTSCIWKFVRTDSKREISTARLMTLSGLLWAGSQVLPLTYGPGGYTSLQPAIVAIILWLSLNHALRNHLRAPVFRTILFFACVGVIVTIVGRAIGLPPEEFRQGAMGLVLVQACLLYLRFSTLRGLTSLIVYFGILLSESRTVIFLGSLLFVLSIFQDKSSRLGRFTFSLCALVLGTGYFAFSSVGNRFTEYGDGAKISIPVAGEVNINSNGRLDVWSDLVSQVDGLQAFLFGLGTGRSKIYLQAEWGWDHPHNEFVRIFFDSGLFGVITILLMGLTFCVAYWKQATDKGSRLRLVVIMSVCGGLALTDIPLTSVFVVVLLGLLLSIREDDGQEHNIKPLTSNHPPQ